MRAKAIHTYAVHPGDVTGCIQSNTFTAQAPETLILIYIISLLYIYNILIYIKVGNERLGEIYTHLIKTHQFDN